MVILGCPKTKSRIATVSGSENGSGPPYILEVVATERINPMGKFRFKSTPNVPSAFCLRFFLQKEK